MPSIISQLTAKNKIINELKISNMSNYGSNSFVIEGAVGIEMYKKISKAFDICVDEVHTPYEIGRLNGKVYTIEMSKSKYSIDDREYIFSVYNIEDYENKHFGLSLAYSWIHPTDIELKDGNLHISESWLNSVGAVEYYIRDVKLHKQTNVYFETNCEADIAGATNDSEGKYFERYCYYECECDTMIPENFNDLPVDEQLLICKLLKDKGIGIEYNATRIIETDKLFG
jgi:hypothetical protein